MIPITTLFMPISLDSSLDKILNYLDVFVIDQYIFTISKCFNQLSEPVDGVMWFANLNHLWAPLFLLLLVARSKH